MEAGCVLRGNRVVVPLKGCAKVFELLHEAHLGVDLMKSLAREYVWWPKIDYDIERRVKSCNACQMNRKSPGATRCNNHGNGETSPGHRCMWTMPGLS